MMKYVKNFFSTFVITGVLFVTMLTYGLDYRPVYDIVQHQIQDYSVTNLLNLDNDSNILQEFYPVERYLENISIFVCNITNESLGDITISILDSKMKKIRTYRYSVKDIVSGDYTTIPVKLNVNKREKYFIDFSYYSPNDTDVVKLLILPMDKNIIELKNCYKNEILQGHNVVIACEYRVLENDYMLLMGIYVCLFGVIFYLKKAYIYK